MSSSLLLTQDDHHRHLYDEDFLNSGCPQGDFDPDTLHDTTVGTYVTNYIVGLVCFIAIIGIHFIFFYHIQKSNLTSHLMAQQVKKGNFTSLSTSSYQNEDGMKERKQDLALKFYENAKRRMVWRINYFRFTGLAYFVAGIGHQFVHSAAHIYPFELFAHVTVTFAVFGLQYDATLVGDYSSIVTTRTTKTRFGLCGFDVANRTGVFCGTYTKTIQFVLVSFWLFFLIVSQVLHMQALVGCYKGLSLLGLGLYYIIFEQEQNVAWLFGLGSFMSLMGLAVQLILAPLCGDGGYEECFEECPLSDPAIFNHNALFHVMVAVGVFIQLIQSLIWANQLLVRLSETVSETNGHTEKDEYEDQEARTSVVDEITDEVHHHQEEEEQNYFPDMLSLIVSILLVLSPFSVYVINAIFSGENEI